MGVYNVSLEKERDERSLHRPGPQAGAFLLAEPTGDALGTLTRNALSRTPFPNARN